MKVCERCHVLATVCVLLGRTAQHDAVHGYAPSLHAGGFAQGLSAESRIINYANYAASIGICTALCGCSVVHPAGSNHSDENTSPRHSEIRSQAFSR